MPGLNEIILVICEGASEKAYIQELNRYFREKEIFYNFVPKPSDGGAYSKVVKKFRQVRTENRHAKIIIWVDFDLYMRNEKGDMDRYSSKPQDIPDFSFSRMNFEDFLSLHFEKPTLDNWIVTCTGSNHFTIPMHSVEYVPLFEVFLDIPYNKGKIPFSFSDSLVSNLRKNIEDRNVPFKCDFATYFLGLINQQKID
jgi:hypothetical protein